MDIELLTMVKDVVEVSQVQTPLSVNVRDLAE